MKRFLWLLFSLIASSSLAQSPPDRDKDGIPDEADQCPSVPEDSDGFEDLDGCPEPDNDEDGILDIDDKCPNEPEVVNEYQDEDGCPDQNPVFVIQNPPPIIPRVYFAPKKADIPKEAKALLKEIVVVLKEHPEIERVLIEGHSDSQGSAKQKQKISEERARVVADFLIAQGVEPSRLVPVGYGDDCPIADNKTKEGREKNRRVELRVLEEGEDPTAPCGR